MMRMWLYGRTAMSVFFDPHESSTSVDEDLGEDFDQQKNPTVDVLFVFVIMMCAHIITHQLTVRYAISPRVINLLRE